MVCLLVALCFVAASTVLALQTSKKTYGCLGTVINKKYVITAAHCILGIPESLYLTGVLAERAGTACRTECGEAVCAGSVPIQLAWMHPDYRPHVGDLQHDIGLIMLTRPLSLTGDYPRAVCLPRGGEVSSVSAGELASLPTRHLERSRLDIRELQLPVVSSTDCKAQFQRRRQPVNETTQLCAGGKGEDACSGDAGGALVVTRHDRRYLLGVTSYGVSPCGQEGWPSVFTRVEHYVPWILRSIFE